MSTEPEGPDFAGLPALGHKAHETCAAAVRLIPIGG